MLGCVLSCEFKDINRYKTVFDDIYTTNDQRLYFSVLGALDYMIPDVAELIIRQLFDARTRCHGGEITALDIGCSYGINAVIHRFPVNFAGFRQRYAHREMMELDAEELTRLDRHFYSSWPDVGHSRFIGVDISEPAIRYANAVGFHAGGIRSGIRRAVGIYLRDVRPDPETEETLLWGDARPGNILFDGDQSVAAVLDWEGALVGPPDLDLGYWVMMDSFHTDMIGVERLSGWPSEAETIARYEMLTGRKARHIDYFVVMGAFFIATTMIRAADIGVAAGRLKPDTRIGHDNTATQIIAQRLGLYEPELSPDFVAHRGLNPNIHRIGP